MPRRSLRPHLNQIRAWVRQGRTDAWVAHQLEVTVHDIEQFKRQNELVSDEDAAQGTTPADYSEEIDLRAEDDAKIAAELEAAELARQEAAEAQAQAAEQARFAFEAGDLLDGDLELVCDPRIRATLACPGPDLIEMRA